jgi:uncharacterized protein YdgA (DUF945 family)
MNKALQLTATSILVSGMSLALPLQADSLASEASKANRPSDTTADSAYRTVSASSEETLGFTLQHRFNGGKPLPTETIKISPDQIDENPLQTILKALKQNFSKHLEKQTKPLQIDTELELLLPARATKVLTQLPKVSIKTNVESDGSGKSDLVFPAYRREVPAKFGKGLIDWKGMDGQFSFTNQFETLTAALNIAGFTLEEEGKFAASLGKTTFSGTFDADLKPTQMNLSLPSFKAGENHEQLNLQAVTLKLNVDKTPKGLELKNANLNVGQVGFTESGSKTQLEGFLLTTVGEVQNGAINYTLQTQIDKLLISDNALKGALELSHVGKLTFSRIDEEALLALQTTAHQMRGQEDHPMFLMMILGQLMELAPKLVAKSPEIALTPFTVTTSKGNLQGNLNIRLDGTKVTDLATPFLIKALQAQANFTIGKKLLEQVVSALEVDFIKLLLIDTGDGNYKLVAELKNGLLTVNGVPIPLPIGTDQ